MTSISLERPEQRAEVLALNRLAFNGDEEARIIEALTRDDLNVLSLVAMEAATVTGHILFSRLEVAVDGRAIEAVSLAPMAVLPDYQNKGIGSALVRRGLDLLAACGFEAVLVVGGAYGFLSALWFLSLADATHRVPVPGFGGLHGPGTQGRCSFRQQRRVPLSGRLRALSPVRPPAVEERSEEDEGRDDQQGQ